MNRWTLGSIILISSIQAQNLKAANQNQIVNQPAIWDVTSHTVMLVINISDLLTNEQKDIVNSGFSTFTILGISEQKLKSEESAQKLRLVCRVKYDTWEERYQTTRLEPAPVRTFSSPNIQSWGQECLKYRIPVSELNAAMKNGGKLYATLQVRQSSPDEALKIKNWLVNQQSGFMQGLYSHMLGDMQLGGRTDITIDVPIQPTSNSSKKDSNPKPMKKVK